MYRSGDTIGIPFVTQFQDGIITSAQLATFNSKQNAITGAATTITTANLTASRALVSDGVGKVAVSAVTATELGYVSGATSNLQAQITALGGSSPWQEIVTPTGSLVTSRRLSA